MSVIVYGMEMPKGCASCRIKRRNGKKIVCPFCDEEWDIHDPMSADFRLDRCPLVPFPPHGRLGDLDKVYKDALTQVSLAFASHNKEQAAMAVANVISNAPTIIPASEETED